MLNAINVYLKEKRAVQEATYPLERLIYCEELCIENAIESAKLKIKEQQLSPAAREHKEKFLDQLRQEGLIPAVPEWRPVPVFTTIHHSDPTIAEAIAERLQEMKDERQTFLKRTKNQLARNPQLKAAFFQHMEQTGADHYLTALR